MLGVRQLHRVFGERTALDHVSFDVLPGQVTGFVGGNGAGKTTTMRIIVGVLAPTSGEVLWDGAPLDTELRRRFGYMPEERGLYPKMALTDQLIFFGRLHGMSGKAAADRATELLDALGLGDRRSDLLETLSLGNQQRVQIAAALMHRPAALILDEPFSGLDPIAVDTMIALLREEITPQMPVLFSSHQLELVERVSDQLVILSHGRVVASGTVADLQAGQESLYRVRLDGAGPERVGSVPGVRLKSTEGDAAIIAGEGTPAAELLDAIRGEAPVAEFTHLVRPLAEIYREAVQ